MTLQGTNLFSLHRICTPAITRVQTDKKAERKFSFFVFTLFNPFSNTNRPMKKFLTIFLLFVSALAYCEAQPTASYLLTMDSLHSYPHYITKNWKFSTGDDSTIASMTYNDRQWKYAN